jgi:hypothetical protein
VELLDLQAGSNGDSGPPVPPFSFQEEMSGGAAAKIVVKDASGRTWEVKWGEEAKAEVFATRLLWATGYYVEPAYFVPGGTIRNVGAVGRASNFIDRLSGNLFRNARFELRDDRLRLTTSSGWLLNDNPFLGTPQLQGLKIMAMLVSNWDLKDPRARDGANTSIVRIKHGDGTEELRYLVNDWGAAMGKWGGLFTRSKWDCKGYTSQNNDFVKGVEGGFVRFGYQGKFPADVAEQISVDDVRWLMTYLGRISDNQLRTALEASGATAEETACFVPAIRDRIEQLQRVTYDHSSTRARQ